MDLEFQVALRVPASSVEEHIGKSPHLLHVQGHRMFPHWYARIRPRPCRWRRRDLWYKYCEHDAYHDHQIRSEVFPFYPKSHPHQYPEVISYWFPEINRLPPEQFQNPMEDEDHRQM